VTLTKGLKHVGLQVELGFGSAFVDAAVLSAGVGVLLALHDRDINRKISPLVPASDAHQIDTTFLSPDEVVNAILQKI